MLIKGRGGNLRVDKVLFYIESWIYFPGAHTNEFRSSWILPDSKSEKKCCSEGHFVSGSGKRGLGTASIIRFAVALRTTPERDARLCKCVAAFTSRGFYI